MQAALRDLTPSRVLNPRPFLICQRVLHRCHEIIFGDPAEPSRSPYRSLPHSPPPSSALLDSTSQPFRMTSSPDTAVKSPTRVNPHVPPSLVGMGTILAATAMPGVSDLAGQWAVIQGRKCWDEDTETRNRVEVDKTGGADVPRQRPGHARQQSSTSGGEEEERPRRPLRSAPVHASMPHHPSATAPNLGSTPPFTPELSPRITTPQASPHVKGEDPFSQHPIGRTGTPPAGPSRHSPFSSVPEFSSNNGRSAMRRLQMERTTPPENLLAAYSPDAQRQLLRSHYCKSQVRFLLLLEDISNRLLFIPKLARVSALRAELTGLNHNLPAEVSDLSQHWADR